MITVLLWIVAVIALSYGGYRGVHEISAHRQYGISAGKAQALSWPAQQIVKEYNSLPKANRPYTNIYRVVDALDTKFGEERATKHFYEPYPGRNSTHYNWNAHRCYRQCDLGEYMALHNGIVEINDALVKQEHALKIAAVSGSLSEARELAERMREETKLINTVTRELT